ncbi:beta-lactamase family protein [Proteobacteria bacterium 005FR1]|nr:beta-lactamase family protein [Proteobacteria bacterium 005FR1]
MEQRIAEPLGMGSTGISLNASMQRRLAPLLMTQQVRGEFPGIGLGWSISGSEEHKMYAHNGGTGGYRTFTAFSPTKKCGVIVMTNSDTSPDDIGIHLMVEDYPLKEF